MQIRGSRRAHLHFWRLCAIKGQPLLILILILLAVLPALHRE
jgi:hypothetical protein